MTTTQGNCVTDPKALNPRRSPSFLASALAWFIILLFRPCRSIATLILASVYLLANPKNVTLALTAYVALGAIAVLASVLPFANPVPSRPRRTQKSRNLLPKETEDIYIGLRAKVDVRTTNTRASVSSVAVDSVWNHALGGLGTLARDFRNLQHRTAPVWSGTAGVTPGLDSAWRRETCRWRRSPQA